MKWHVVLTGLSLLSTAILVSAQETPGSFEQLGVLVKAGDVVTVNDRSGERITGRIASLSSSTLEVLDLTGQRHAFAQNDLNTISRTEHGNLGKGAAIGFGIGAAFGTVRLLIASTGCYGCGREAAGYIPVVAAFYGGIGSAIGVGISAAATSQQTIFQNKANTTSQRSVSLAPVVTREQKAMLVSLRF